MPTHVIDRVNEMRRNQDMPTTLTFDDRHANEIPDNLDELTDEADAHDEESYAKSETSGDENLIHHDD